MSWKPTPSIAAVLGLLATPLGMLYVQRPGLAVAYLVLSILAGTVSFFSMWAFGSEVVTTLLSASGWVIAIACAVHAFRIARDGEGIAERKWYSRWYGLASLVAAVFITVFLTRAFLYEPFRVPSQSMHPNLPAGSLVFVEKWGFGHYGSYGITLWQGESTEKIQRGDILVHGVGADTSGSYISRVVGLPGEHVRYFNRELTINGRVMPVSIRHRDEIYQYATERLDERDIEIAFMPDRFSADFNQVVRPNQYVVFGDNRDNARDSRYIGAIPQANIVGRVAKVLRPRAEGPLLAERGHFFARIDGDTHCI